MLVIELVFIFIPGNFTKSRKSQGQKRLSELTAGQTGLAKILHAPGLIKSNQFGIKMTTFSGKFSFLKIIGEEFRTDCVCSLSGPFHTLIIKTYCFSSDLKSYVK